MKLIILLVSFYSLHLILFFKLLQSVAIKWKYYDNIPLPNGYLIFGIIGIIWFFISPIIWIHLGKALAKTN